jgi:hypothetical protein
LVIGQRLNLSVMPSPFALVRDYVPKTETLSIQDAGIGAV